MRIDFAIVRLTGDAAGERGKAANARHRAELTARKAKRESARARKKAEAALEHSIQVAHASQLAMTHAMGRMEREANEAANDDMRLCGPSRLYDAKVGPCLVKSSDVCLGVPGTARGWL